MSGLVLTPLVEADDPAAYGGKGAQLAAGLAAGLPVPDGYALSWEQVDAALASADGLARLSGHAALVDAPGPWAVRSSAVGEDSAAASFAGAHESVLGVVGPRAVAEAVRRVHASAADPGARAYRDRLGVAGAARMAVVIQRMVAADVAGVLFTRNPVTGECERVVEASWGLGESVVSGCVTPDHYRLDAAGRVLARVRGEKDVALWLRDDGSVEERAVSGELVEAYCLLDDHLAGLHALAAACDTAFGESHHDIEFAFAGERLFLLQRRPLTRG